MSADENRRLLEEERKKSLADAYKKSQGIEDEPDEDETEETPEGDEQQGVDQKSSGNDEDSPYLENDDAEEDDSDDEVGSNESSEKSVLNNVFDGDTSKMERSYLESQKEYNRLSQKHKQILKEHEETKELENVLNQNPALRSLFDKAQQGEDVESLINKMSKPSGKSTGGNTDDDGKLDDDEFLPDTERLIELGYIQQDLSDLTDFDRERVLLKARNRYLSDKTPEFIQKQVNQALTKAEKQKKQQAEKKRLQQTNNDRFENGFDQIIIDHGLNFTGEDQELFDEIYEEAKAMRDPSDTRLIRENAVQLATQEVLRRHNRDTQPSNNKQTETKESKSKQKKRVFTTSGKSGKADSSKDNEPKTREEKMKARRLERIGGEIEQRQKFYRK